MVSPHWYFIQLTNMLATTTIGVLAIVMCSNTNFDHSARCQAPVETFIVDEQGEVTGQLTNGIKFTQTNVVNDVTRLQRFQLEDAFWFVSDKGEIHAESDLAALSIYLAI